VTVNVSTSPALILNYKDGILKASTEVIAAYFQSVLDGRATIEKPFQLRADCPFHIDNDESFVVDLQNGDYRCRCSRRGSIQQFEMRRAGEDETPWGWTDADRRIITIANKALGKSHA
jgi:hypothetical protein